jgi:4-amino-4-deoxy-L-arabinose transferase-like glycosyltransferase
VGERLPVRDLALVAFLALGARIGYAVAFMRHYVPDSDADSYFSIGRAVSRGEGYAFSLPFEFVHATAIRPPLYPTVLAGVFRVFGVHVGVAQGVNIVAGCAAVVLGALIAARIAGPRAGLCAGIVLALYPPLLANDVTVLVESFALLLVFATVLLLVDGRTALAGVALGLLMLDRSSAQWFVIVIAGWVLWRFGWRHAARLVVVALLVASPWIVRNAVQVGGPVLVATNGFNLNATYSDEARQSSRGFVDAYFDSRFAQTRMEAVDEVDLDNALRHKAVRDLREHPARILHVARLNFEHWFELRPGLNQDAERLDGRNLTVREWTLPLFYLVTVAGLFALVRARRAAAAQLLALAAAYFTVVCLFSISVPRLRSVFDGCVAVGAGITLGWVIGRNRAVDDRPPKVRPLRAVPSGIILGVVAVVVATTAFAWRSDTHRQARRSVETAVERDTSAIDALIRQYHAGRSASEPPRLVQKDLDRIQDLTTVLGNRAPQVATALRAKVAGGLRAIRIASHEANVISLLSAAEYIDAAAEHRPASRDAVRTRYEREIRSGDPTLEPWEVVLSGRSLVHARSALRALDRVDGV